MAGGPRAARGGAVRRAPDPRAGHAQGRTRSCAGGSAARSPRPSWPSSTTPGRAGSRTSRSRSPPTPRSHGTCASSATPRSARYVRGAVDFSRSGGSEPVDHPAAPEPQPRVEVLGRPVGVREEERELVARLARGARHDRVGEPAAAVRRRRVDALDLVGVRRREQQAHRDRASRVERAEGARAGQLRPPALPAQHRRDRVVASPRLRAHPLLAQRPHVVGGHLGDGERRRSGGGSSSAISRCRPTCQPAAANAGASAAPIGSCRTSTAGAEGKRSSAAKAISRGPDARRGRLDANDVDLAHPRDALVEHRRAPRQGFRPLGDRILDRAQVRDDAIEVSRRRPRRRRRGGSRSGPPRS